MEATSTRERTSCRAAERQNLECAALHDYVRVRVRVRVCVCRFLRYIQRRADLAAQRLAASRKARMLAAVLNGTASHEQQSLVGAAVSHPAWLFLLPSSANEDSINTGLGHGSSAGNFTDMVAAQADTLFQSLHPQRNQSAPAESLSAVSAVTLVSDGACAGLCLFLVVMLCGSPVYCCRLLLRL